MPLIRLSSLAHWLLLGWGVSFQLLLTVRQQVVDLPRETVTHDDIEAMTWLRDHAPEDAVLLAADGEGWLPIYAQRRTVAFRAVAYFEWDTIGRAGAEPLVDFVFQSTAGAELPELPLKLVFEQGEARVYELVKH